MRVEVWTVTRNTEVKPPVPRRREPYEFETRYRAPRRPGPEGAPGSRRPLKNKLEIGCQPPEAVSGQDGGATWPLVVPRAP